MTESTVLYEEREAGSAKIALITLNRPAALNSFVPEMHRALRATLAQASANAQVRACRGRFEQL
jgi:2-(1,2-epoxy-1,2-dihydrophenyl)acetyl-CoA isomerase